MFDWIWGQLQTNQFFSGTALTGLLIGAGELARRQIVALFLWMKGYLRISIQIHSEDPSFHLWLEWVRAQKFDTFQRSYRLRKGIDMTPAYGTYCLWQGWRPIWIGVTRDEAKQIQDGAPQEFVEISTYSLSRRPEWFTKLVAHMNAKMHEASSDKLWVYKSTGQFGNESIGVLKRQSPVSVVMPAGQLEAIEADIDKFFASEELYLSRAIPWRRGYLLHGLPGTGKTSLIRHLARKYASQVYVCDMRVPRGDEDERLFLVFEDIDFQATGKRVEASEAPSTEPKPAKRKAPESVFEKDPGVALGELLNKLDGIAPMHGALIFMTTNHRDKLDPALIRPGRIDYEVEFTYATLEQATRIVHKFFPDAPAVTSMAQLTTAQVQAKMQRASTSEEALALLREETK